MSSDVTTKIAGLVPTFSAREAAALLNRSYSWLDQRLRQGELVRPDGSATQPLRSLGGYRYFTFEMLKDIVKYCYRQRSYSFQELRAGSASWLWPPTSAPVTTRSRAEGLLMSWPSASAESENASPLW
jgi:hypothetical protein